MKTTMPIWSIGLISLMTACSEHAVMKSADSSEGAYGYGDTGYYATPEDSNAESDEGFDDGLGSETESDFMSLRPATTDAYVLLLTQTATP